MLTGLLPIYFVSAGIIGLLALFGHQNRRAGYQRARRNVTGELNAIGAEWEGLEMAAAPQVAYAKSVAEPTTILPYATPSEAAAFSGMLATLHTSLNKAGSVHPQAPAVLSESFVVTSK